MAEAVLCDIVVGLISKVGSLLVNEIGPWQGVKNELGKLKRTVSTIESVLLHAEEQYMENPQVKNWLDMLSEALYDADDLLDEFSTEALHQRLMGGSKISKKVRIFFSSSNQLSFGLKMADKVKDIRERLDEIAANRRFHLEERLDEIAANRMCQLFPLLELQVWLMVKNVLESASGHPTQNTQMELLTNSLHEHINGRRYLLVLDDVWNVDVNKWSSFKDLLDGGARGSKIVITTRHRTVAEVSRPISIHELRGLSENESWSLFEQVAFKQGQLPNPSLEAIGKEITAKCCGVPLAIKTIGGVLYFKDPDSEWILFKDNKLSKIDVFRHDILPILKLSYNHLPSHYKHCFAFCSLYPKDFKIPVDELIQLWKAQGYVKSTNLNECLRDAGYEYFMDLYRLSFFQDVEKGDLGNIEYCKMHDLMHDLAISVAGDKFSASHSRMACINDKTQHMSFQLNSNYITQNFSSLLSAKMIRTVLSWYKYGGHDTIIEVKIDAMFRNLRYLRVLDLSYMKINTLSNSIYKLKHLRYLNLSNNNDMKELPDSIADLLNLQVLDIKGCSNLMQLPTNVTKLVNLTDLNNHECNSLSHMPLGIGKMTKLEKLPLFVIAKDHSISKYSGGLDELHSLNNLRGELEIKNLSYVKSATSEFKAAHLNEKKQLQLLNLDWSEFVDENNANDEMVMEALCPHPNLKRLKVRYYGGAKPPSWLPSVTNLVCVRLQYCRSIKWLPPFDHLPYLKKLHVWDLAKLECIYVENGGGFSLFFPSLIDLTLGHCPNLKGFQRLSTEELPCFPSLFELHITGCPSLTYLPHFQELKTLLSNGDGMKSLMEILKMPTTLTASESTSSSFSTLSQLQYLHISHMEDSLEDELLQYLHSLQRLTFYDCSFRTVCRYEEDGMHWQSLHVLRSVQFYGMKNLEALPEGLQYVTSLQRLCINECRRLACIPKWISKLIALQDLRICHCPLLELRCKNNWFEDWPYISHIPNINIGWTQIQRNGCYLL